MEIVDDFGIESIPIALQISVQKTIHCTAKSRLAEIGFPLFD
jgi:hypothetical protein